MARETELFDRDLRQMAADAIARLQTLSDGAAATSASGTAATGGHTGTSGTDDSKALSLASQQPPPPPLSADELGARYRSRRLLDALMARAAAGAAALASASASSSASASASGAQSTLLSPKSAATAAAQPPPPALRHVWCQMRGRQISAVNSEILHCVHTI